MWLGFIQSVEGLNRTKRLIPTEYKRILLASKLQVKRQLRLKPVSLRPRTAPSVLRLSNLTPGLSLQHQLSRVCRLLPHPADLGNSQSPQSRVPMFYFSVSLSILVSAHRHVLLVLCL